VVLATSPVSTVTDVTVSGTGSWVWSGGTLSVAAGGVFTYGSTGDSEFSGILNGAGSLVISSGAGELTFTNDNTYAGATTVDGGILQVKNGGKMRNSGVTVKNGGKVYGKGHMKSLIVVDGGITSPGASPGTMSADNETWADDGIYQWEINDADATKGGDPGWDWKDITDTLTISATESNKFVIDITSLTLGNIAGDAVDFDNTQQYSWIIATAGNGITGFAANKFELRTTNFSNDMGTGYFTISTVAGAGSEESVALNFVPEPTGIAILVIGGLGLVRRRRRRP